MWNAELESLVMLAIAGLLGAALGLERKFAQKPAGIRTHIFVAMSAAFLMILGQQAVEQFRGADQTDVYESDPIRVLQAIVVGISFLGAGTIIHHRHEGVEGLTTAATILLTAAIGIAVAVDRTLLAVLVTLFTLFVLLVVGFIEKRIERWTRHRKSQNDPRPTQTSTTKSKSVIP